MTVPVKRSPKTNAMILCGIFAFFLGVGLYAWFSWDHAAVDAVGSDGSSGTALWALVVIGGPVILLAALIWSKLRARRLNQKLDPTTRSDNPSKGMSGHD